MYCTNCGNEVSEAAIASPKCGVPPRLDKKYCHNCAKEVADPRQVTCTHCGVALIGGTSSSNKNKTAAGILGILLGGLGAHKFYLGSWGWGIIYILLIWTYIPSVVGLIEGIIYLTMDDHKFDASYGSGTKDPFKW